jgi:D-alanine-D-alanine ligase
MIDVAVLGGGVSAEHEVSLGSATEVIRHLDRSRWRVWPVLLDRAGFWRMPSAPVPAGAADPFLAVAPTGLRPGVGLARLLDECGIRIVFPMLHGRGGEDGTVQGMLDLHGVAYVGSGTAASAVGMDKIRTRECLAAHGVPMAPAYLPSVCVSNADPATEAERIASAVGFPCFLKIDLSGSSFGVARAEGPRDVERFLRSERGRRFVAERLLEGEEISVAVLGNCGASVRALTPIGIYPLHDAFFDSRAKYEPGRTEELVPPRGLDAAQIEAVQALAIRCHGALGCDGVSRTDMIVTADGPRVLEVNTLPGLTPQSLLPKAAAHDGIPLPRLLDELLSLALERHARVVDGERMT